MNEKPIPQIMMDAWTEVEHIYLRRSKIERLIQVLGFNEKIISLKGHTFQNLKNMTQS